MKNQKFRAEWVRALGLFTLIATELVVFTLLGVGAGYWAYKAWNWPYWITTVTGLIGLGLALFRTYRWAERESEKKSDGV